MWIIRDTELELIDENGNSISEDSYLEMALKDRNNDDLDPDKPKTRSTLRKVFKNRCCV